LWEGIARLRWVAELRVGGAWNGMNKDGDADYDQAL